MKICPICNRTYVDETINFCLDDGSTLTDAYASDKSQSLPATMLANPAPTEVLNPGSVPSGSSSPLITTIQSLQPPPLYSPKLESRPTQRARGNRWVGITIGASVVLILGVLSMIWLVQRDQSANSQRETTVTVNPSPTPTATKEDEVWKERNDAVSLAGENLTYYPGTTPEACQSDCDKDKKCKGFTFIRKGAYNPNDPPMCYQLSVVTAETPHRCCISAVKR